MACMQHVQLVVYQHNIIINFIYVSIVYLHVYSVHLPQHVFLVWQVITIIQIRNNVM
jgi:hypothetical protein